MYSFRSRNEDKLPEYDRFRSYTHPPVNESFFTLNGFVKMMAEHDACDCWSGKSSLRATFPRLFELNLLTLPHITCNAFIESAFSIAGRVLEKDRMNMGEELMEATIAMGAVGALNRSTVGDGDGDFDDFGDE